MMESTEPANLFQSSTNKTFEESFFIWGQENLRKSLLFRDKNVSFSKTLFRKLAKSNLFRIALPQKMGGLGLSLREEVYAMRGLAKGSLDLPFCLSALAHNIGIKALIKKGSSSQCANYLNSALSGECLMGIANSEETGGTDIKSIQSKLELERLGDEYGILSVHKNCASNVSDSDLILTSVWKHANGAKPSMEVMLLDRKQIVQTPLNDSLIGFRTGQTGSLSTIGTIKVRIKEVQLGPDLVGYTILKLMFNLDRLFVSTMVAGMLEGVLELALKHLSERSSFQKPLADYQYMQQKVVDIYTAHLKLWGILHSIIHSSAGPLAVEDLSLFTDELSVLKISAIEDGLNACISFFEIFGYRSYMKDSVSAKLLEDILAFKFLGGSKEQQKILLFDSIYKKRLT